MQEEEQKPLTHYFVNDVETDGQSPLYSSMLSFATIVVREDGRIVGEFEAVLEPRSDKEPHPDTMAFWKTQPEAWAAATNNPQRPKEVMTKFAQWVKTFAGPRSFAARPLMFDGIWMEHYLREFTDYYLLDVPY